MYKFWLLVPAFAFLSFKYSPAQPLEQGIDKIFTAYQVDSGFTGIAILVKNDTVVLHKGYGAANEQTNTPITTKTLFNVASIGKQFTAVTVLKLEEQGLLNTKDHVWKYVGKLGGLKDSATIQQLLLHTSGLFVDGYPLDYDSRDAFITSVGKSPVESRPGEKHRYSNAGYTLLAAIVEIVTKQPFEDVLYKMIFQPAGMNYTGYPWEKRIQKNLLATGYNGKGEALPAEKNIWGNRGPGNIVTNSEDMLKWYRSAWTGSQLISREIKDRMLTDYLPGRETFSWNKLMTPQGKRLYYKGGGRDDFQSQVMWWPDDRIFLFFSTNRDKDHRRYIYRDINVYMNKLMGSLKPAGNAGQESGKISLTLRDNHTFIQVFVNDKPLNFLLDIGASGIGRIDQRIVREMRLDTVGYQDNSDGVNTAKLPLIGVKSLLVGGVEMKNVALMSRDYNRTKRDVAIDGIIGREFFERYLLTIDYPNREVEYSIGSLDRKSKNVLPYERPSVVKGKLGKKEYEFLFDTGSNLDFHFPRTVLNELKHDTTGERRQARRANTEFVIHGVIIKEKLQIGKVNTENFRGYFSEPQTLIFIGGSFLKSYRLTIDQKNKCLTIE